MTCTDLPGRTPLIVGLGGTFRPGSTSERCLRRSLDAAQRAGARTLVLASADLDLPVYRPGAAAESPAARRLIDALREADGVIVSSPSYHGSVSGLVKNALDYAEELREDSRPYLDGRAVGVIACAGGAQGSTTTLAALRDIVHALRGWPTPFGAGVVAGSADEVFADPARLAGLDLVGTQVAEFAAAGVGRSTLVG